MHIEKNICESLVGTLLDIDGKTKDIIKARLDLQDINIRKELHLIQQGNKLFKPHACYTLTSVEKIKFCRFLKSVKFPYGYASNIAKCVTVNDDKLSSLKSHDCHVLLERLLPIGIRLYLLKEVCTTVIAFCIFFRQLCAKTVTVPNLDVLEKGIIIILNKLERIFPVAFFDVMVHLDVHYLERQSMVALSHLDGCIQLKGNILH